MGDNGDEDMEGDENLSLQHAEGGSGSLGGIKKGKRRRGKQKGGGHRRRHPAMGDTDLRLAAYDASVS